MNPAMIPFKKGNDPRGIELELLRRNRELSALNSISEDFIKSKDLDKVLDAVLDHILIMLDVEIGWISVFDEETGGFVLKKSKGIFVDILKEQVEGLWSVLTSNDPFFLIDLSTNPDPHFNALRGEGVILYIGVPLRLEETILGVMNLACRKHRKIGYEDLRLLSLIGNHLTMVLEKIRLYEEANRLAVTDGLTGIYNSRHFYRVLETEIARTDRYGVPFSLIIFDIDNFKKCNDTYGHKAGDDILQGVACVISSFARKVDIVARYGGEEFVILLPNTEKGEAMIFAERIRKAVEEKSLSSPFIKNGYKVTVSGGIATYPADGMNSTSIMYAVDQSLYIAKGKGKNRVWAYEK
jgi:diguanylate cyclase (GGDEF)-like protein